MINKLEANILNQASNHVCTYIKYVIKYSIMDHIIFQQHLLKQSKKKTIIKIIL